MTKIGTIGGSNPKPETFGRRNFLGPWSTVWVGDNKQRPSGETIPLNPVYGFGIPNNVYWTEHAIKYWSRQGTNLFSQEGVKMTQTGDAKNASQSALFYGFAPTEFDFTSDEISQMIPSANNGTPGIVGIGFDWERDGDHYDDKHRQKIYKVGLIQRTGDATYRFRDCAYKTNHSPAASGDLQIFTFRSAGTAKHQQGSCYCPVRTDIYNNSEGNPPPWGAVGLHHVVGIAIQFTKESGGNSSHKSGSWMRVSNFRFHTAGNKEIILPRKKVYPRYNQYPDNKYEFYTW